MKGAFGFLLRYQLFIFDLDGTVVESSELMTRALRRCYSLAGQSEEPPFDRFFSLMGAPLQEIFRQLGLPGHLVDEYRRFCSADLQAVRPYIEVVQAIRHLSALGKNLALFTGKDRARTHELLAVHGMEGIFGCVVASEDVVQGKPHPEGLDKILLHFGDAREAALMIGDAPFDIQCAERAGVDSALALWGPKAPNGLSRLQPRWRFENPHNFRRAVGDVQEIVQ